MRASPRPRISALAAVLSLGAAAAATALLPPASTTIKDFFQPGTQPGYLLDPLLKGEKCRGCHGGLASEPIQEPWKASMHAQATRDPIFRATLVIANADAPGSGDLCLRCHAPNGWLANRCKPDGTELTIPNNNENDFDGVNCHFCHRLVDPRATTTDGSPAIDQDILADLPNQMFQGVASSVPVTPSNGQYVVHPRNSRRGPYDLAANASAHAFLNSPYHRKSDLCGTCHDVSNPAFMRQPNGTYALVADDAPHPTQDKKDMFPIERTFSEWAMSAFQKGPIDLNFRFGGNRREYQTCQDCHMPRANLNGCSNPAGPQADLAVHDFNGGNTWVIAAVKAEYPGGASAAGLDDASVAASIERSRVLLRAAADLHVWVRNPNADIGIRVVNHTGHKLPTGYGEGRLMWLNVQFLDAADNILAEYGAYDAATSAVDTSNTTAFELQEAQSSAPNVPSFHFVLNNLKIKDNRIPPRGFTNGEFKRVQAEPVGETYAEERYWYDTSFTIPIGLGATQAKVTLYHQTTTKPYIEFLRDNAGAAGQNAHQRWLDHGQSAPTSMQEKTISLLVASCVPPINYGTGKKTSAGRVPTLVPVGAPGAAQNSFKIKIINGVPGKGGSLFWSPTSASSPFHGGTLLLAVPYTRAANFVFDAQGEAVITVPVTTTMVRTARNYQAIFSDDHATDPFGLSDALHVFFCP